MVTFYAATHYSQFVFIYARCTRHTLVSLFFLSTE